MATFSELPKNIRSKISGLLSMINNVSSEQEKITADRLLTSILVKYGLTIDQVIGDQRYVRELKFKNPADETEVYLVQSIIMSVCKIDEINLRSIHSGRTARSS